MNKKPIAQSALQHYLLGNQAVYGLLSHLWAAIVVCCFTLSTKFEVRYV
ncbi:acid stress response protein YqgB [Superficieibacter sp.]|nr:acid stress response protein YqgB [Superficieibacter sp.]